MGIYWRLKSVPELKGLDNQRRIELYRKAKRHTSKTFFLWFGVLFLINSVTPIISRARNYGPLPRYLNWIMFACALLWIAFHFPVLIATARPHMKRILNGCCSNCGYDLRATPDRCPECGTFPKKNLISK